MDGINTAIYIAILLSALSGFLNGLRKGLYKSLIDIGFLILTVVVSIFATKLVVKNVVDVDFILSVIDGVSEAFPSIEETMATVRESVVSFSSDTNAVGVAVALPAVIISPIVYMIIYLLGGFILKIPKAIISRILFGPSHGEGYRGGSRIFGGALGAVADVVSLALISIPFIGYIYLTNDALLGVSSAIEQTEIVEVAALSEEQSSDTKIDYGAQEQLPGDDATLAETFTWMENYFAQLQADYVGPLADNNVIKSVYNFGGKWLFSSISSVNIDDASVSLVEETDFFVKIYPEFSKLIKTPVAEYGEAQTEAVTNITNIIDDATAIPAIASGLISHTSKAWLNGEAVFGYEKINVGEYYEPTLDKILTMFSTTTEKTVKNDIHTIGNLANICISQGFFKETFGGGTPINVVQKEEFLGEIFVELYKNEKTRQSVGDIVNSAKNYIYRIYNDVNGTAIPFPSQIVMDNFTEDIMYDEGALLGSVITDFRAFLDSVDKTEEDNTKLLLNTNVRALGRAIDNVKRSLFLGDSYEFLLEAVLKSEGAAQFSFITPDFIQSVLENEASMETILVTRQEIAIIASVVATEDRTASIEHLLKNIDSQSAEIIKNTITPDVLQGFGMSADESAAMSGTLGSIVDEIAANDTLTDEELHSEIAAVDKIISTVQAATDESRENVFSTDADESDGGISADELVSSVVESQIVSSAIVSSSTDADGNKVEDPYNISEKLSDSDKDSAKTAIESYYSSNASADDAENEELKNTLDSLAHILGVEVTLGNN